jgi:hypothetical protein
MTQSSQTAFITVLAAAKCRKIISHTDADADDTVDHTAVPYRIWSVVTWTKTRQWQQLT